ncbi:unnamed protein product [Sphagnum balticum]
MVHPQKRRLMREMLDNTMVRTCEIKQNLLKYSTHSAAALTDVLNLDEILLDLKLTPRALRIPLPRHFSDPTPRDLVLSSIHRDLAVAEETEEEESKDKKPETGKEGKGKEGKAKEAKPKEKEKGGAKKNEVERFLEEHVAVGPTESVGLGKRPPRELLEELYERNVAKVLAGAAMDDFLGEHNTVAHIVERNTDVTPDPSLAQVRNLVAEYVGLPLGSVAAKERLDKWGWFLFYGAMGTGKTLLVRALQKETHAVVFDLTPDCVKERYSEKA